MGEKWVDFTVSRAIGLVRLIHNLITNTSGKREEIIVYYMYIVSAFAEDIFVNESRRQYSHYSVYLMENPVQGGYGVTQGSIPSNSLSSRGLQGV